MRKKLKIVSISLFLSFAILLSQMIFFEIPKVFAEEAQDSTEAVCYSENDKAVLYADANGHFKFTDKESEKTWYSIPSDYADDNISVGLTKTDIRSELIVEYFFRADENTNMSTQKTNSYTMCETGSNISVKKISNGFRAVYNFDEIGIKIPVEYILNGAELDASIITSEIDEGDECYLVSVELLPYFGAAGSNENGYLFIPDGCGAIAKFNQNITPLKTYEKTVYGSDLAHSGQISNSVEQDIRIPVFGMVYSNATALMGQIIKGDGAASIIAETGNESVYYNTVSSKMLYRIYAEGKSLYATNGKNTIYTVTHNDFGLDKYTVRYYMLSGAEASYNGMAKVYRNYLSKEYSLKKKDTEQKLALRIYGCLETEQNFVGFKYYKKQALTTFEQSLSIIEDLKNNGCKDVAIQYMGWNGDGVYNRKLSVKAKPLSILGGSKAFASLVKYAENNNIEFYPDNDLLTFSQSGNSVRIRKNSAKAPNGDNAKQYSYSMVTYNRDSSVEPWYLLSLKYINDYTDKFLKNYSKLEYNSVSLSTLGKYIYSDFKNGNGLYRAKSIEEIQNSLKNIKKNNMSVSVSGGNAYVLPYVNRVFDAPVTSSGYDIFAYDVPFYQMALSGYISYTTPGLMQSPDYQTMFLKAIETGSDLLYDTVYTESYKLRETRLSDAYSSQYSLWSERASLGQKELEKISSMIDGSSIAEHCCLADNIYSVRYENGIVVYVNYNSSDVTVQDITVPSLGYLVKEG